MKEIPETITGEAVPTELSTRSVNPASAATARLQSMGWIFLLADGAGEHTSSRTRNHMRNRIDPCSSLTRKEMTTQNTQNPK